MAPVEVAYWLSQPQFATSYRCRQDTGTACFVSDLNYFENELRRRLLGLVLSSQRPSELSPTVLSQCNTFLLHRISNDRDQELVHRLVPDNLRGLLRELPSLPSQHAILLGWASELPVLTRLKDLPREQQPQSEDPDFWAVWSGETDHGDVVERKVDWQLIAEGWQRGLAPGTTKNHISRRLRTGATKTQSDGTATRGRQLSSAAMRDGAIPTSITPRGT